MTPAAPRAKSRRLQGLAGRARAASLQELRESPDNAEAGTGTRSRLRAFISPAAGRIPVIPAVDPSGSWPARPSPARPCRIGFCKDNPCRNPLSQGAAP